MPFRVKNNIANIIASLEQVSGALFSCFKNNHLRSNVDKCHLLVNMIRLVGVKIGDCTIDNSECEKLLCVKIDVNLSFNDHISDLYKKASRKISALVNVTPFMGLGKRKLLINAFLTSQFSYYPLICNCHSHSNNRKINMLHERCLKIIFNDKQHPSPNY